MGLGSLQWCPARGNGHKVEHRKLNTNTRRKTFLRVTEPWNRLPRMLLGSTSLEILRTCLDTSLCNLLQGTCFSRGLDSVLSRGLFQPLRFCDCVIFQGIFSEYSYSKAALLMLALQSEKLSRYHANNSHRLAFIRAAAIRLHFKIFIYVFSTGL